MDAALPDHRCPAGTGAAPSTSTTTRAYRRWRDWQAGRSSRQCRRADRRRGRPARAAARPSARRCWSASPAPTWPLYRCPVTAADKDAAAPARRAARPAPARRQLAGRRRRHLAASPCRDARRDGRGGFIPYTDRAIRWHTDGYYHPPSARIRGMILHCVRPAASGGDNGLIDHEMAYIALRDADAGPRARADGSRRDDHPGARRRRRRRPRRRRPARCSRSMRRRRLHMRYTARTRSIEWKDDAATREAVAFLRGAAGRRRAGRFGCGCRPAWASSATTCCTTRSAFVDDPRAAAPALPRALPRPRRAAAWR